MINHRSLLCTGLLLTLSACTNCNTGVNDPDGGTSGGNNAGGSSGGFQRPDGGGTQGSSNGGVGSNGGSGGTSGGLSSGGNNSSGPPPSQCGPREICGDGLDNNCSGAADEDCDCVAGATQPCYVGDPVNAGVGQCTRGTQTCISTGEAASWGACVGSVAPAASQCGSGIDYSCTGDPDRGCACSVGHSQACYTGRAGTQGVGACHAGTQVCVLSAGTVGWGTCTGEVTPAAQDLCDSVDLDCDGNPNTGCACAMGATQACYSGPAGTAGVGSCKEGTQTCQSNGAGGTTWGTCAGEVVPQASQACDGTDRMCNGNPGQGCACTLGATQACYSGPAGTQGVGLCHGGTQTCQSNGAGGTAWGACSGEVVPQASQACDGTDRMCNGNPAQGCACSPGATQACYDGAAGTQNVGPCHGGTQSCVLVGASYGWGNCNGEVTPAAAEMCGNNVDDNCNTQVDEGCSGNIQCPGPQVTEAGTPIALSVSGAGLTNVTWAVTDGPLGGASSAEWQPAPSGTNVTFNPIIVGVYTITVTGQDANGVQHNCTFTVTANSHGLRVELSWDGTGDVDLHLHNGNNTPWFNADDCYYGNCTGGLPWGPALDVDNVVANGPENIRINTPTVGTGYIIGIHNYRASAGRTAVVNVFCGTTAGTTPTQTFTSVQLSGAASGGQCNDGSFWHVATVTFSSAQVCTITPINTYNTGAGACAGL